MGESPVVHRALAKAGFREEPVFALYNIGRMAKHRRNNMMKGAFKIYRVDGEWVEEQPKRKVLKCPCGGKYIKTRRGQAACVPCIGGFKLSTMDRNTLHR